MYFAWIPMLGAELPHFEPKTAGFDKVQDWPNRNSEEHEMLRQALQVRLRETSPNDLILHEGYKTYYGVLRNQIGGGGKPKIEGKRQHKISIFSDQKNNPRFVFIWQNPQTQGLWAVLQVGELRAHSGIFSFTIDKFADNAGGEALSNQLYRFLRKCFHCHLWNNGDFNVMPTNGDVESFEDAPTAIWDAAFNYRLFRWTLEKLRGLYFNTPGKNRAKWRAIRELCAGAKGELIFSEALASHIKDTERARYKNACLRGKETYENIWSLLLARHEEEAHRTNLRNIPLTVVGIIAAAFAIPGDLLPDWLRITILVIGLGAVFTVGLIQYFETGYRKEKGLRAYVYSAQEKMAEFIANKAIV